MASHQVAIAKASFAASLIRPDPTPINRNDIGLFHTQLDETVSRCSSSNVQKCKVWLAEHVSPSQGRITAFAKYLVALSASFDRDASTKDASRNHISTQRKRLHLLYILNDLLHHTRHHARDASRHMSLASTLQPHLVSLFASAAAFDHKKKSKHCKRIEALLDIWEHDAHLGQDFIGKIRQTVENAGNAYAEGQDMSLDTAQADVSDIPPLHQQKEAPFVMPSTHGDTSLPWYDLPAGNMLPHIVPNSTQPIKPQMMKPLQFTAGPADDKLTMIVKDFLTDVEGMYVTKDYLEDEQVITDIDEMGQRLIKDEATGDLVPTQSYYGWSVEFCNRLKSHTGDAIQAVANGAGRGRSRSRSSSASSAPRKRRRYSSSRGSGRSRSASRSPFRTGFTQHGRGSASRRRSHSRSRTRSRSRCPKRGPEQSSSRPRPRSHSRTHSPRPPSRPAQGIPRPPSHPNSRLQANGQQYSYTTPADQISDPFNAQTVQPAAPSAPNASHFQHNYQFGPGGLPIPPPPPFHKGPWPPPPPSGPPPGDFPPQAPQRQSPYQQNQQFMPPPPPPGQYPQQQQGQLQQAWQGFQQQPNGQGFSPPPPPPSAGRGWKPPQGQGQWRGGGAGGWRGRGGR